MAPVRPTSDAGDPQARAALEPAIAALANADQKLAKARAGAEHAAIAKRAKEQLLQAQPALLPGPAIIRSTAQQAVQEASDAALAFQKARATLFVAEQEQAYAASALNLARSALAAHDTEPADPKDTGHIDTNTLLPTVPTTMSVLASRPHVAGLMLMLMIAVWIMNSDNMIAAIIETIVDSASP